MIRTCCCLLAIAAAIAADRPLMRDFVGINGHTFQFRPALYAPVAGLARDYHPYTWDVRGHGGEPPILPLTREQVHNGAAVNWETVYGSWVEAGFSVDACITFGWHYSNKQFVDFPGETRGYAEAFARHFGPSGDHPLVTSMEIANEPRNQKMTEQEYTDLFVAMASGIRAGDPAMKIATCTVSHGKPDRWEYPIEMLNAHRELYDVINMHTYAFLELWPTWSRTYPEDGRSDYMTKIDRMIAWRDAHAPDKEIWVTEFGYDAPSAAGLAKPRSKGMDKFSPQTELQQAQWNLRSYLALAKRDIDRAYVYFFNDNDSAPSFHANSGLTRNFVPKPAYHAQAQFYGLLKDLRFKRVVQETPEAYVYAFAAESGAEIWVAWRPSGDGGSSVQALDVPATPQHIEAMRTSAEPTMLPVEMRADRLRLTIDESPCYIIFGATP